MLDVITYSPDVTKLGPELKSKRKKYVDDRGGEIVFKVHKTPTKRVGNKTLSKVRVENPEDMALFDGLQNVQVLGTIDEVMADPAKLAIYRQFYPGGTRTVEILGNQVSIPEPEIPDIF